MCEIFSPPGQASFIFPQFLNWSFRIIGFVKVFVYVTVIFNILLFLL